MPLSDAEVERYARQIIISGFGTAGQEAVLAGRVLVRGHPAGVEHAERYLRATGVGIATALDDARIDCIVLAGTDDVGEERHDELLAVGKPIVWYRLAQGSLFSGIHRPERPLLPPRGSVAAGTDDDLLHAVAASDAAASAVALLIGWELAASPVSAALTSSDAPESTDEAPVA